MENPWFKCVSCGYVEARKAPDYIKTSSIPCPCCGGKMVRK